MRLRSVHAVRALARVERRSLFRHRRRSLLVILLIAVPVAAVVGGAILATIVARTPEERRTRDLGTADLAIDLPFEFEERERLMALLPADARTMALRISIEEVSADGLRVASKALVLSRPVLDESQPDLSTSMDVGPGQELAEGMFVLRSGRLPRNAGEVALSPLILSGLARGIGDKVVLEYGGPRTITGVVVEPEALAAALVVRTAAAVEHGGRAFLLVRLNGARRGSQDLADSLRAEGFAADQRSEISGDAGELGWVVMVLGGIGFLEAGLVVAATFIVGLKRRQHEIGLLSSAGATISGITTALVYSSFLLALAGGVAGTVMGVASSALVYPFLDGWNGRLNGPFEIPVMVVVSAVLVGILVALLATVFPARAAARRPVRDAIGGSRPCKSRSRGWLLAGAAMVVLGALLLAFVPTENPVLAALGVVFGAALGVFGFGVASPFVLDAIGRRAGRLPLAWRLAVRDAGRFRVRNGPVVTAILAGMSMGITVVILVASVNDAIDAFPSPLRSDQLLVEGPGAEGLAARLVSEFGGTLAPLQAVYVDGEPVRAEVTGEFLIRGSRQWIAGGDDTLLTVLGVERQQREFRAGRLLYLEGSADWMPVELDPQVEERAAKKAAGREVVLSAWRDGGALPSIGLTRVKTDQSVTDPVLALHVSEIERRGWELGPPLGRSTVPWLVRLHQSVSSASLARARTLAKDAVGVSVDAQLLHENPARSFGLAVKLLCILTGLIIVLVATGLSAAESEADEWVLHSVGASPQLLCRFHGARAGYLALLGCALAVPAGVFPLRVVFSAVSVPMHLIVPWRDIALIVLGLPVVAFMVSSALGYRRATKVRTSGWRLRLSVFAGSLVPMLALGLSMPLLTPAPLPAQQDLDWTPHVGQGIDGSPLAGELAFVAVPADAERPEGSSIKIAVVRYRTHHPEPGTPVLFLIGGPGGSGVEHAAAIATHPQLRFLEHRDFIGVDQRGTGRSLPDLTTPAALKTQLPVDRPLTREGLVTAMNALALRTQVHWTKRRVDLSNYNTRESARDMRAVREALGLRKVVLYASSYGTHLGLEVLRQDPEGIERAVFGRVEGPTDTFKYPSVIQSRLEVLARRVGATDEKPGFDLLSSIQGLLAKLRVEPVEIVTPEVQEDAANDRPIFSEETSPFEWPTSVVIGPYDLQIFLANALSFANTAAAIPSQVAAFESGDWTAIVESVVENRRLEVAAMPWAMECSSGGTAARLAQIRDEATEPTNLLGDAIQAPYYPEVCRSCRGCDLGALYRAMPQRTEIPVLFISGLLDPRTPAANVNEVASSFPRHVHILVENAGHESRELMSREFRRLFQEFVRGETVGSVTLALPSIPIGLLEEPRG